MQKNHDFLHKKLAHLVLSVAYDPKLTKNQFLFF